MGRLPPLIARVTLALSLAVSAGCDAASSSATPSGRSEQVLATTTPPPPSASAPAASATPHGKPTRATRLCDGEGNARGRVLPKATFAHVEASGAARSDGNIPRGRWTWVNFWAAWCAPCKEELPRLLAFQDRFSKTSSPVRFVFISLDDDRRQLQDFIDAQPAEGVRSSLWLPEGPNRTSVLGSLRMKSAPELPEQAIVDPTGRVRCFIEGAIEDSDFDEIAALVAK
jgi:thiol-disulfide isomerase/thioredoxin